MVKVMFLFNGDWTIRSNSTWSKKSSQSDEGAEDFEKIMERQTGTSEFAAAESEARMQTPSRCHSHFFVPSADKYVDWAACHVDTRASQANLIATCL